MNEYKRILVTGNAGSGKTTLAKKLSDIYKINQFGLDKIVWSEDWKKTSKEKRRQLTNKILSNKLWIIDGVDFGIIEEADQTIFLDLPRRTCYMRVVKRNYKYLFKSRPELPNNCPEINILPYLIKLIWNFPKDIKPRIIEYGCSKKDGSFIHIKTQQDLENYLIDIQDKTR